MTPKRLLRTVSIAEAVTWAILLAGMALKYGAHTADWLVTVGGSLHGAVFLSYLFCGLLVGVNQRFGWGALVLGGLASVPPFATLLYDWWAERRGLLDGEWRRVRVTYDDMDADDADAGGRDESDTSPREAHAAAAPAADERATETAVPRTAAVPAHPADARVAERGERPARLQWLDPLVRWSVDHPATLVCTAVLVAALIFTGAASGSLTAPYEID